MERKHGVCQDRLVKELRLEGIRDIEGAKGFLPDFCQRINEKFAVAPRSDADFHRPVAGGMDLREVFCLEDSRSVSNDCVVHRFLHVLRQSNLPPAKQRVTVRGIPGWLPAPCLQRTGDNLH